MEVERGAGYRRGVIRIHVVDDHAILRRGLRDLLDETGDMRVVGESEDGRAALYAPLDEVDVLVLDLTLPKVHGSEVLRRVHERRPGLPVVVLSMHPEAHMAARALQDGAAAYVSKDAPPRVLLDAIRAAARGQRATAAAPPPPSPHASLSAREHQVFTLIIQGRSVGDIAAELDLTSSTVSNHLARIREKLGVQTVAEIVNYAHRTGLID